MIDLGNIEARNETGLSRSSSTSSSVSFIPFGRTKKTKTKNHTRPHNNRDDRFGHRSDEQDGVKTNFAVKSLCLLYSLRANRKTIQKSHLPHTTRDDRFGQYRNDEREGVEPIPVDKFFCILNPFWANQKTIKKNHTRPHTGTDNRFGHSRDEHDRVEKDISTLSCSYERRPI